MNEHVMAPLPGAAEPLEKSEPPAQPPARETGEEANVDSAAAPERRTVPGETAKMFYWLAMR
ncbi:hypothetical protein [Massilia sp. METH4]|uniref:hypothetical protein n=1 Tax=Massilia sp. METH4 TaxID=3123041 RepID=UPI0030D0C5E7